MVNILNKFLGRASLAVSLLFVSPIGQAAPILQSIAPVAIDYTFGVGNDFTVVVGTGFGDVTANLWAVDLQIPSPGGSDSGCEAADFAGFAVGSIALIQRGTCSFEAKALNAEAAGAAGVLLFNEGNSAIRMDAITVSLGTGNFASVPVFFSSFGVGSFFSNGILNGSTGYTVRMKVAADDIAPVPEPATFALLLISLAGLGAMRCRKRNCPIQVTR